MAFSWSAVLTTNGLVVVSSLTANGLVMVSSPTANGLIVVSSPTANGLVVVSSLTAVGVFTVCRTRRSGPVVSGPGWVSEQNSSLRNVFWRRRTAGVGSVSFSLPFDDYSLWVSIKFTPVQHSKKTK